MSTELSHFVPNAPLRALPLASCTQFKSGMRNFVAGVHIITAALGGERAGLTATAVVSVTADPPRLAIFVNKNVAAAEFIVRSGSLCVNTLSGAQEEVSRAFAGMIEGVHGSARFDYGHWDTLMTGAPTLHGALVNFDTRVIKIFDESTHYACLCEVLTTREHSGTPLLYYNGNFIHLS